MATIMLHGHRVSTLFSCGRSFLKAQACSPNKLLDGLDAACVSRPVSTINAEKAISDIIKMPDGTKPKANKKAISKAMKSYLLRAKEHDEFMKKQSTDFEIGKRHLANIMSMDADTMSQDDIDKAIEFLFPSGLYEPLARPIMRPPEMVFPPKKAAEFDESGRPHHSLFYTLNPNFYQLVHDAVSQQALLNKEEDNMVRKRISFGEEIELSGTEWLPKEKLSKILIEEINDSQYEQFLNVMSRLADHPLSNKIKDYIMKFRYHLVNQAALAEIPKPMYDKDGRAFVTIKGSRRKSAFVDVTVHMPGTGQFLINDGDIQYFDGLQGREQITFPLIFTALLGKVDVKANSHGGGPSSQAGALRYGLSMALRSFVDDRMVERMRLAGLLQVDWRGKERKKPGQPGARKKATWKAR